ncbi:hypothetical protein LAZ67_13001184 [Cordylochernes scorpioides]|uniref:Reverse transcriptase domain-containing protein n=1 Tax=Cordylochernes scorpioides TaxID=51811 RepID=A0ABY6L5I8_9ARAC|nr:hypothetical protein LAZ67_13001184 [Cordylochernes scorpioides]
MGKILDKIIVNRTYYLFQNSSCLSSFQYGFRWGKSSVDIIDDIFNLVRENRHLKKHSIIVSLDIEGAFDNASYDLILQAAKNMNIPSYILNFYLSFLSNRKTYSEISPKSIAEPLTINKGCPQGSNSGPLLWLVLLDSIFYILKDLDTKLFAYADDLLLICCENSRYKLEKICNNSLDLISIWLKKNRLGISVDKCSALYIAPPGLNKGLGKGGVRNPVIKINNTCIKFRNNVNILGIVINRFLNWIDHAKYVKNKMCKKGREIRKISTLNWGLSPAVIKRIYLAGFERAIVYGAKVWWGYGDNNKSLIKILRSTQRPFALAICRGYNTLSTDAALFLSGLIPIELVLNFESKITCLNRPINIFKIGPNSNVIDIPSLNYFCDPADYEIINFTKELPTILMN